MQDASGFKLEISGYWLSQWVTILVCHGDSKCPCVQVCVSDDTVELLPQLHWSAGLSGS